MIFPYLNVRRGAAVRTKPIVPIRLHGPAGHRLVAALVDSGAEQSVFSAELIDSLGLPTDGVERVEVVGVGGQASPGYLLDVDQQLRNHRWRGPAVFCNFLECHSPMILGEAGFFEFFTVTFKRRELLMDIRRAR